MARTSRMPRKCQRRPLAGGGTAGGGTFWGSVEGVFLFGSGGIGQLVVFASYLNNITFGVFVVEQFQGHMVFYGVLDQPA